MILTIPTFTDPFYTITVGLDGRDYVMEFRYNQRGDYWTFSMFDTAGTALIRGVKVVCSIPLLRHMQLFTPALPQGLLMAVANGDNTDAPGLLELGQDKRVTLYYWTADELEG